VDKALREQGAKLQNLYDTKQRTEYEIAKWYVALHYVYMPRVFQYLYVDCARIHVSTFASRRLVPEYESTPRGVWDAVLPGRAT
jgi:hypothetical protein